MRNRATRSIAVRGYSYHSYHRRRTYMMRFMGSIIALFCFIALGGCSAIHHGSHNMVCTISPQDGYLDQTITHDLTSQLRQHLLGKDFSVTEESSLHTALSKGCRTVITYGDKLAHKAVQVAPHYSSTQFIIGNNKSEKDEELGQSGSLRSQASQTSSRQKSSSASSSIKYFTIDTTQAGIIVGYASAAMTQSGTVGALVQDASGINLAQGFAQGVGYYNQVHGTAVKVLRVKNNHVRIENDPSQGVKRLIRDHADVILSAIGKTRLHLRDLEGGSLATMKDLSDTHTPGFILIGDKGGKIYGKNRHRIVTNIGIDLHPLVRALAASLSSSSFDTRPYEGNINTKVISIGNFRDYRVWISPRIVQELHRLETELGVNKSLAYR